MAQYDFLISMLLVDHWWNVLSYQLFKTADQYVTPLNPQSSKALNNELRALRFSQVFQISSQVLQFRDKKKQDGSIFHKTNQRKDCISLLRN